MSILYRGVRIFVVDLAPVLLSSLHLCGSRGWDADLVKPHPSKCYSRSRVFYKLPGLLKTK